MLSKLLLSIDHLMHLPIEKWDLDMSFSHDFNTWTHICKKKISLIILIYNLFNIRFCIEYILLNTESIKWVLPIHPYVFNVILVVYKLTSTPYGIALLFRIFGWGL